MRWLVALSAFDPIGPAEVGATPLLKALEEVLIDVHFVGVHDFPVTASTPGQVPVVQHGSPEFPTTQLPANTEGAKPDIKVKIKLIAITCFDIPISPT